MWRKVEDLLLISSVLVQLEEIDPVRDCEEADSRANLVTDKRKWFLLHDR